MYVLVDHANALIQLRMIQAPHIHTMGRHRRDIRAQREREAKTQKKQRSTAQAWQIIETLKFPQGQGLIGLKGGEVATV